MEYKIVRKNVELRGYLTDVAVSRLEVIGTYITTPKNNLILNNSKILEILSNNFMERANIKELKDNEITGNTYIINNVIHCLIFPIDLVMQNHIIVSKWRLA